MIVMLMLTPFVIFVGVMIFLLRIVPFTSALSVFVFKLAFCFALFSPLYFLDQGIWMRFLTWTLL